jgi:nuclear receptor interaction protein
MCQCFEVGPSHAFTLLAPLLNVAFSWSKSGNLLASGSDDTYLNIWSYNPDSQARPFSLNTSVSTGHTQNIFSVKFMPHSNDRTVITAAGDAQVRIFDIERGGASSNASADSSTRSRRFNNFFSNAKFLNEANTNARIYRSHADRVKRIVTESSPHLFLTCSEDGEVRQWDLRQPSSAYPSPRGGTGYASYRLGGDHDSDNVPPPLISYKKYSLDLNSISCSGSQPQYIALGGAHLHCFLHDRRMLGRDIVNEWGQPRGVSPALGSRMDEEMSNATRCVRRFAPHERRKMGTHGNGHITACKISDANANEMIASWSGEHIYSFDLVKSPDARDTEAAKERAFQVSQGKLRDEQNRKRKRAKGTTSSPSVADTATARRRLRKVSDDQPEEGHTALRVRYGNGQTEDISISVHGQTATPSMERARDTLLTEAQKLSERVAKSLVKLRKTLFDFSAATQNVAEQENSAELTPYTPVFTDVLGQAAALLTQMDVIIRDWSYPMDPSPEDVTLQQTMRRNRQASWRFVQAAGCLAKTLGGRLQTLSPTEDPRVAHFGKIRPATREGRNIDDSSRFCYDFLKAILLWLDGGKAAVVEGFTRPPEQSNESQRFPLDADEQVAIDDATDIVLRYLSHLASDEKPVVDLDANRFERNELRFAFESQKSAVEAFSRALKGTELRPNDESSSEGSSREMPGPWIYKRDACRFWGFKVGRALLMDAGEGVNFAFVNQAFGGLRLNVESDVEHERSQEDVDPDEEEEVVDSVDVVNAASEPGPAKSTSSSQRPTIRTTGDSAQPNLDGTPSTVPTAVATEDVAAEAEEDADHGNEASDSEREQSDAEDDDDDGEHTHPLFRRRVAFGRSRERALVNIDVPYSSHTRRYKGHCNTKTVKDVNFYGLNDEYVVSGSDCGHFFIWDRKTTEVVNILEGDGEVVNVVQGHPYEPMIAVSGIDSTVKIFGSGGREREDAEKGVNIANPGGGRHSSLRIGGRRRRHGPVEDDEADADGAVASNGLPSRKAMQRNYEITNQNELDRTSGVGDAFITVSVDALFARAWLLAMQGGFE